MSGKGIIGSIVASVTLSAIITGGLSFLILPIIYPNMKQDEGIVLQEVYVEFNTAANITYNNISYQKIPDTEASITIKENSKLSITFNAMFMLLLEASYSGACAYNISLVVNGYGNKTYTIAYIKDGTGLRLIPINFYATFITGTLSTGTYLVEVYWKSYNDVNPDHSLLLNDVYGEYLENPRSLILLELA
ncbi:MAG: hypothetical protein ACW98D_08900 [Promethearchaeota archaeon]|jgi:hypothetical protein